MSNLQVAPFPYSTNPATIPTVVLTTPRVRRNRCPFGGVQLVMFGDFCMALGTEIVMADGSLRVVEDVQVGDEVMGPDSQPRNVVRRFRGTAPLYRVQQANADPYFVTANHQLALQRRGSCRSLETASRRRNGITREWTRFPTLAHRITIRAEKFTKTSLKFRECFGGYKAGCLQLPERQVSIDPYFLGVWLGDGHSCSTRVTSADPEVIEYCTHLAEKHGLRCELRRERLGTPAFRINLTTGRLGRVSGNPLKNALREYGVLNNKHIPDDFLLNSESLRLHLLAGLLDTDGCWSGNRFIYCTKLDRLAKQVKQLCDHLGFRTALRRNHANVAWELSIGGDTWRIPTQIARKKSAPRRLGRSRLNSTLAVAPVGSGDLAGIEVDGDHLFLLADGTVTHNCQLPPVSETDCPATFPFESRA